MKTKLLFLILMCAALALHAQQRNDALARWNPASFDELEAGDTLPQMYEWAADGKGYQIRKPDCLDLLLPKKKFIIAIMLTSSVIDISDSKKLKKCFDEYSKKGILFLYPNPGMVNPNPRKKFPHDYARYGIFPEQLPAFHTWNLNISDLAIMDKNRKILKVMDVEDLSDYLAVVIPLAAKGEDLQSVFKPVDKESFRDYIDTTSKNLNKYLSDQAEITRILVKMETNFYYYFDDRKLVKKGVNILERLWKKVEGINEIQIAKTMSVLRGNPKVVHLLTVRLMQNWKDYELAGKYLTALTSAGRYDPKVLKLFITILDKKEKYNVEFIKQVITAAKNVRNVKTMEYLLTIEELYPMVDLRKKGVSYSFVYHDELVDSIVRLSMEADAYVGYAELGLRGRWERLTERSKRKFDFNKSEETDRIYNARSDWTNFKWETWIKSNKTFLARRYQDERKKYLKPEKPE